MVTDPAPAERPDDLALAGDWTHVGLDAGCVESAATSGLMAARAVMAPGTDEGKGAAHP